MVQDQQFAEKQNALVHVSLNLPDNFSLARAICSYGFFLLPPNRFTSKSFVRPLNVGDSSCWLVELTTLTPTTTTTSTTTTTTLGTTTTTTTGEEMITDLDLGGSPNLLNIAIGNFGADDDTTICFDEEVKSIIVEQVRRMLRLDLDLTGWFATCPRAKTEKFGWLFRSPTLFEDMVKTICTCNTNWKRTKTMCLSLCAISRIAGSFPTPKDIVEIPVAELQKKTGLGYRAPWVMK